MVQAKRANPHSVPAVGYTRRSTDKQEASIADQVRAVQEYADAKGYEIVRWYSDDAISGDDTENRDGFQQMLADAETRRDFQVIICWDQSRFGRFSPQEGMYWSYRFTKADVRLVTTDKGLVDWNDFTGSLTYFVDQHAKHQFLVNLSRDVTRGQLEAAKKGSWLGLPPYGYRIEGERKNKRLVIDSQGKVDVIRRVFREFVDEGRAMSDIARRLQESGIVAPGGKRPWRYDSVRTILENPAYAGDYTSGRTSYGKYHRVRDGHITRSEGGARKAVRNPKSEWIVRRDNHEAIIDRDTFERAQHLLSKGKTGRNRFTPETNPFVLTGLLRCGKCGSPMWGDTVKGRKFYRCGNWQTNGPDACAGTKVSEDTILCGVADHLEQWLGIEGEALGAAAYSGHLKANDVLPEAFEKVKKLLLPPTRPRRERDRMVKQATELAARIEKARGNLPFLDRENLPAAQETIRQLVDERAAIEAELQQSKPPAEKTINEVTELVLSRLYALAYCCRVLTKPAYYNEKGQRGVDNGDGTVTFGTFEQNAPSDVRRFLSHVTSIVCHSEASGKGTGTRHKFLRGEIVFRGVGGATKESNPHNRAS